MPLTPDHLHQPDARQATLAGYGELESIRSAMIGNFYSRFAVSDGFDLYFPDFVLSSQEIISADEQIINASFVALYPPAQHTANPDRIAKSAVLAVLDIPVNSVDLLADSSLLLTFSNGVAVRLPTDTPIVDWHWAITERGGDPYSGCHIACFAPDDIQGSMVMVSASQLEEEGFISSQEAERVLGILCVKYGFCLPSLWHARLRDCPPHSIAKFTDTVFHAEGLDPRTADRAMYKGMFEEVRLAFERRNATGGMPSNTSLERTREG